jgi:hypothetical protein
MNVFVSGALMFGFAIAGLFFYRFWKDTRDRLFLLFALAFFMLSVNRIFLVIAGTDSEIRTYLYCIRLAAFGLIIYAIVEKNLAAAKPSAKTSTGERE